MDPVSLLPDHILGSTPIITSGPRTPIQYSYNAEDQTGTATGRVYTGSGCRRGRQRRESSGPCRLTDRGMMMRPTNWESQKGSSHLWLSLLTLTHKEKLLPKVEMFLYGPRELENSHIGRAHQSSRRNLKLSKQLTWGQEIVVFVPGERLLFKQGQVNPSASRTCRTS